MLRHETYTPTSCSTAADKAKFLRQFQKFVESDFAPSKFPKWFYNRLSMTFGHIAHYNKGGFFGTFFESTRDKVEFLRQTLGYGCYGDAGFTYCDVERDIQSWLREQSTLAQYQTKTRRLKTVTNTYSKPGTFSMKARSSAC